MNPVQIAVDAVGGQTAAAKICGLSVVAVHKWYAKGRLPRTEYTKNGLRPAISSGIQREIQR